ncbi:hypothetical protein [Azospirillum rugosum]|uniref:Uncharacterized protein n=1 Tax=Azospirillum rugosum TaxID=416170 RepID=A0ABS4SM06_9PROT|nr:hypothetical protein [Azospirillum rugosum]MBP2293598.1 hypothetical protein [Azospirillum rugosum]MDQ0529277.1 hypothetical protein [Azospirillum rugosum]
METAMSEFFRDKMLDIPEDDLSFCEFISRSHQDGQNPRNQVRYHRYNISESFSYISDFFRVLERCLFQLPDGNAVFDSDLGYVYPSQSQIENFTGYVGYEAYINRTRGATDDWVDGLISKIRENRSKKGQTYLPVVEFILGKVGSGKSTFIKFVENGYKDSFANEKILFVHIDHSQFTASSNIQGRLPKDKRYARIRDIVLRNILVSFQLNSVALNACGGVRSFVNGFKEYCQKRRIAINDRDLYFIINPNADCDESVMDTFGPAVDFLRSLDFYFLIAIDGMDALTFDEVVKGEHAELFDDIATVLFGVQAPQYTVSHSNYIVTLRNCTHERFVVNHSERMRRIRPSILIPCEFRRLLERGVRYYIHDVKKDSKFWRGGEEAVSWFMLALLEAMERSLGVSEKQEISALFDHNHRHIMESLVEIASWLITRIINQNSAFKNVFEIFEYVEEKDLLLLKGGPRISDSIEKYDQYDVFEAYLIREGVGFFNKFSIGEKIIPVVRGASIDNIFNYHMVDASRSDVHNFLVLKLRVLQLLAFSRNYVGVGSIRRFLYMLGYTIEDRELMVNIDLLHSGSFVKVRYETGEFRYCITKFGTLFLKNILWNTRYIENAIQETLVPRVMATDFHGCFKYGQRITTSRWIENSLINCYLFLQIVRNIEDHEMKCFMENGGPRYYRKFDWRISEKFYDVARQFIDVVAKDRRLDIQSLSEEMREITDELRAALGTG